MRRRCYGGKFDAGGFIIASFYIKYSGLSSKIIGSNFAHLDIISRININGIEYKPSDNPVLNSKGSYTVKYYLSEPLTDTNGMYSECSGMTSVDLSKLDTSQITEMKSMFYHITSLETVDMSLCDLRKASQLEKMFMYCESLVEIKMLREVSKTGNTNRMFEGVYTSGVFKYNPQYDYSFIINSLPGGWTSTPTT